MKVRLMSVCRLHKSINKFKTQVMLKLCSKTSNSLSLISIIINTMVEANKRVVIRFHRRFLLNFQNLWLTRRKISLKKLRCLHKTFKELILKIIKIIKVIKTYIMELLLRIITIILWTRVNIRIRILRFLHTKSLLIKRTLSEVLEEFKPLKLNSLTTRWNKTKTSRTNF
jgi:hypothetical protein